MFGWILGGLLKLTFVVCVLGLIAVGVLRYAFVDIVVVGHNAMAPTLIVGEQVVSWRDAALDFGEIALCEHPRKPGRVVIGRVVGRAGTQLQSNSRGQFVINGQVVPISAQAPKKFYDEPTQRSLDVHWGIEDLGSVEHQFMSLRGRAFKMRPVTVKQGLFLLGDNRTSRGNDSRFFGSVDQARCRGQIIMRLRPSRTPRGDDFKHDWLQLLD